MKRIDFLFVLILLALCGMGLVGCNQNGPATMPPAAASDSMAATTSVMTVEEAKPAVEAVMPDAGKPKDHPAH